MSTKFIRTVINTMGRETDRQHGGGSEENSGLCGRVKATSQTSQRKEEGLTA